MCSSDLLLARGASADDLTRADFRMAFVAVAVLGMLVLPSFLRLDPNAGAEVSGHRKKKAPEIESA